VGGNSSVEASPGIPTRPGEIVESLPIRKAAVNSNEYDDGRAAGASDCKLEKHD